jgi:acetyl esterase/lipase
MTGDDENKNLLIPARAIPVPRTVSSEAQAFLASMGAIRRQPLPSLSDKEAWRAYIAEGNEEMAEVCARASAAHPADILTHKIGAADLYEISPRSQTERNKKRAIFYIHGGGFIGGGGITAAHMATELASAAKMRAFSVDYRMPPDHPFPVGLDDTIEAYRWVLARYKPANIAACGVSAGGGLAASFLLKARDLGLPMPGACMLGTPELDLTESGDTFETNDTIDVVLKGRLTDSILLYADGHDLRDPYLSALYGDFSKGFPPTILTSGTRDLFLSNTVRMHRALRRAGVKAELHVFEAMPHAGFLGTAPEDLEVVAEQAQFIESNLGFD